MDFAGSWYPRERAACAQAIAGYQRGKAPAGARLALAPHAGWMFSGALAGAAFQALAGGGGARLVIVLGGHLSRTDPLIVMGEGAWETPFGAFPVHTGFGERLKGESSAGQFPVRWESPAHYQPDNSTELQLPFARRAFPEAELLALRVPPSPLALRLGGLLADYLAQTGLEAVAVASTDLTHYGPNYGFEPQGRGAAALRWAKEENDPAFIRALGEGSGQAVLDAARQRRCACSAGGVAALAEVARRRGLAFESLGYATSADSPRGDGVNFVGYLAGVWR